MSVPRKVTRDQGRSFSVGICALVIVAAIGYVMFTANQGRLPFSAGTVVKAEFQQVGQLDVGSDVRQNSMRIGQVTDVRTGDDHALVTMELTDQQQLFADARAQLGDQSALGQKYVELRPGNPSAGPLGNDVIPVARTESAHDLADLLDVFDAPTRRALSTTLRELGGGVGGRGADLNGFVGAAPRLLRDAGTVTGALAAPEANLADLVKSAERLSGRFSGREHQLASLLRHTDTTLQAINVRDGRALADTIDRLPATLRDANGVLQALDQPLNDTRSAMASLRTGAKALGVATPDLRGTLREGVVPLQRVPAVTTAADPAVKALDRTFGEAQPLMPKLSAGLDTARTPLQTIAPYACDIGSFSYDISNVLTDHVGWRHRLRIVPVSPSPASVNGLVKQPTYPYPAPCQSYNDRAPLGGLLPDLGGGPK